MNFNLASRGWRVTINFDFPAGGSCLNHFNKIIKIIFSLPLLARVLFIILLYFRYSGPYISQLFLQAQIFILFGCFYSYNHADFDRRLNNKAFRWVLFFPIFFLPFYFNLLLLENVLLSLLFHSKMSLT